ncbi:MAG TPA: universal stress protein [Pseudonocardiaceae bacterium]|jgi:nucleotide-binding universal stress UspA family protein
MSNTPVVVGVDGSDFALTATEWAADEAARRHARLHVVHANLWPTVRMPAGHYPIEFQQPLLERSKRLLDTAVAAARREQPGLEVSSALVTTTPVDLLVAESRNAQLVVLGARGLGGFAELLAGSVAIGVASHARCPVAVIRGRTADAALPTGGPVVVGVDGSPGSTPALRYAFDAASRLGAPLVALHTWLDVPVDAPRGEPPWMIDWDRVQDDEQRLLAERLAGWQQEYPDVAVARVVTRDRPVRSLLQAAGAAQLVVVGSRGRGGFAGMLLGSTSHALTYHCPCPLVVVRDT